MNEEEFLNQEGVFKEGDIIWMHLSPICNWFYILKGLKFTCPFCNAEREFDYLNDETASYGYRSVVWTCKCGQKFGAENYDIYYGD